MIDDDFIQKILARLLFFGGVAISYSHRANKRESKQCKSYFFFSEIFSFRFLFLFCPNRFLIQTISSDERNLIVFVSKYKQCLRTCCLCLLCRGKGHAHLFDDSLIHSHITSHLHSSNEGGCQVLSECALYLL